MTPLFMSSSGREEHCDGLPCGSSDLLMESGGELDCSLEQYPLECSLEQFPLECSLEQFPLDLSVPEISCIPASNTARLVARMR